LRDSVLRHGVCGEAPLLRELGIDPLTVKSDLRIRYRTRAGAPQRADVEVSCRR